MRIDKGQVLDILRSLGKDTDLAERELPDQIDTDDHAALLDKYGISGGELVAQFGGGGDAGDSPNTSGDELADGLPAGVAGLRGIGRVGGGGI